MRVEMRCESCGEIPPPDDAKSNKNWTVFPTVCPADGGRVKPVVVDSEKPHDA